MYKENYTFVLKLEQFFSDYSGLVWQAILHIQTSILKLMIKVNFPQNILVMKLSDIKIIYQDEKRGGYGVQRYFQQYFSYIVAISFTGGENRSTQRKLLTCSKP